MKTLDLAGKKFGLWTVLSVGSEIIYPCGQVRTKWRCRCECGTEKEIVGTSLIAGTSRGCRYHDKKDPGFSLKRLAWAGYKHRNKKFIADFTIEEFHVLAQKDCFYCGVGPSNKVVSPNKSKATYAYNGIDRVDSTKGYAKDNIVTSCANCNRAKLDLTQAEFFNMVKNIYERHLK